MANPIDKTPTDFKYIKGVKCLQCDDYISFKDLKERFGTIFVVGCEYMDGGEYGPVFDMDLLRKALDPKVTGKDVAKERVYNSPGYFAIPELLPLTYDGDKPRIHVNNLPFSPLDKSSYLSKVYDAELYFLNEKGATSSFKDRPVTMAVNILKESGYNTIVNASTGNLVMSCLKIGPDNGLNVIALLPDKLSKGKINKVEELVINAKKDYPDLDVKYYLYPFDYSYINDTIANKIIDRMDKGKEFKEVASPNRGPRLYYGMGSWTAMIQLALQLKYQYNIKEGKPINIYVSGGSGKLLSSMAEASKKMQELNILNNPIRMWIVQPELNMPLVGGFKSQVEPRLLEGRCYDDFKYDLTPVEGKNPQGTICESVAIKRPGSFLHTMKSLSHPNIGKFKNYRGGAISISDSVTIDSMVELALNEGRTPQFVGGLAFSGFKNAIKNNPSLKDEIHVVYLTGEGKDKIGPQIDELIKENREGKAEELKILRKFYI